MTIDKRKTPKEPRNKHQKAADIKTASELRKQGKPLREIGKVTGLSHETVRKDLAEIDQKLLKAALKDADEHRKEVIAKLRHSQIEAINAWKQSLTDSVRAFIKDGKVTSEVQQTQDGNAAHLRNFISAIESEAKLLGLYESDDKGNDNARDLVKGLADMVKAAGDIYADSQETGSAES